MRCTILQPQLRRYDITDRFGDLRACLVDEMLVSCVEGRRLAQDFLHHPIVCSYRFNQVLSVPFVVDLECGPSRCEFHFPAELSITASNINFAAVTAALERPCPKLHSFAHVFDDVSFWDIF